MKSQLVQLNWHSNKHTRLQASKNPNIAAMEGDLICNFKKCRKRLSAFAYVTSCSHVFCDEHGSREFDRNSVCPACETELGGKYDIIRVELQPSEEYKSMVLAGQRPEVIMEICSRAMAFWNYQAHQERAYQEYLASKAIEKAQQQEGYYRQMTAVNESELTSLRSQVSALRKDLESMNTKNREVSEKLLEKTRQYQKLQGMYETLRRRNITPLLFEGGEQQGLSRQRFPLRQHSYDMPLGTLPDRESNLPPGQFSRRQHVATEPFPLHVPQASAGHGVAVATLTQAQANMQLDPSLAAMVNAQSQATSQGRTQQQFTVSIGHSAYNGGPPSFMAKK